MLPLQIKQSCYRTVITRGILSKYFWVLLYITVYIVEFNALKAGC